MTYQEFILNEFSNLDSDKEERYDIIKYYDANNVNDSFSVKNVESLRKKYESLYPLELREKDYICSDDYIKIKEQRLIDPTWVYNGEFGWK